MQKKGWLWLAVCAVVAAGAVGSLWILGQDAVASTGSWAIKAEIAESCSCKPACPCVFGSPATRLPCEGSRLIEIKSGHFEGVRLDDLPVVVTFRMGEWSKYYIDDDATEEQAKAAEQLISHAFASLAEWGVRSVERAPVSIERGDKRVKFSVPRATVEMELMQGRNGKPVTVQNLPGDSLEGYTQYVSVENSHDGKNETFAYSGTNGFTSRLTAKN